MGTPVVAVDFGASSVRVCRVELGDEPPTLAVVHRHEHGPVRDAGGHLRWDWPRLVSEMRRGLDIALGSGPVASIGIDTWGVDYGLLDAAGDLIEPPFSYRDGRTTGYREVVDLSPANDSRFIDAVGESGHPLSRHYDDFLNDWQAVRHRKMRMDRAEIEHGAIGHLRLMP